MSNELKVSQMETAIEVADEDYVMIIQNGTNKKALVSDLGSGGTSGGDTLPIGAVIEWLTSTIPNNWLLCNGQAVSRSQYPALFSRIGTTFGEGDGSTTFNLPDKQGLISIGAGTHIDNNNQEKSFVLGREYGEYEHTLTVSEMASHYHRNPIGSTDDNNFSGGNDQLVVADSNNNTGYNSYPTTSKGGDQSHNNIQPSIAVNFIIKAKQSVGVIADLIQEDGTATESNVYSAEAVDTMISTNLGDIETLLGGI